MLDGRLGGGARAASSATAGSAEGASTASVERLADAFVRYARDADAPRTTGTGCTRARRARLRRPHPRATHPGRDRPRVGAGCRRHEAGGRSRSSTRAAATRSSCSSPCSACSSVPGTSRCRSSRTRTPICASSCRVDSPGLKAFEHQLGRVGRRCDAHRRRRVAGPRSRTSASSTTSPARLNGDGRGAEARAGPQLISYIESGSKDVHALLRGQQVALRRSCRPRGRVRHDRPADRDPQRHGRGPRRRREPARARASARLRRSRASATGCRAAHEGAARARPRRYRDRWKAKAKEHDDFPTGYFETDDGTMIGLRIVSFTTGMGDAGGDTLLARVQRLVDRDEPGRVSDATMKVGFAGDIPNAAAEKESIVSQAAWASGHRVRPHHRRRRLVLPLALVARRHRVARRSSASAPPTRSRTSASAT